MCAAVCCVSYGKFATLKLAYHHIFASCQIILLTDMNLIINICYFNESSIIVTKNHRNAGLMPHLFARFKNCVYIHCHDFDHRWLSSQEEMMCIFLYPLCIWANTTWIRKLFCCKTFRLILLSQLHYSNITARTTPSWLDRYAIFIWRPFIVIISSSHIIVISDRCIAVITRAVHNN